MNKISINFLCGLVLAALVPLAYGDDGRLQDRKEKATNEELRRAVKADREAAQKAHEREMPKQRATDAKHLANMEKSKQRYRQVLTQREATKKLSPQERERNRAQAPAKGKKQK